MHTTDPRVPSRISAAAKQLKASRLRWQPEVIRERRARTPGLRVIEGHIGEPKFRVWSPFWLYLLRELFTAIRSGRISYSPTRGSQRLIDAVIADLAIDGVVAEEGGVFIGNGSSELLEDILFLRFNGKKVLVHTSRYPNYFNIALRAGVKLVEYRDLAHARELLDEDDQIMGILANDPRNPDGVVLAAAERQELADLVITYGLHLIADEAYSKIWFAGSDFQSMARLLPWSHITILRSASKDLGMPGIRVAWALMEGAGTAVNDTMFTLMARRLGPTWVVLQNAVARFLRNGARRAVRQRAQYQASRDALLRHALRPNRITTTASPQGAIYVELLLPRILDADVFGRWFVGEFSWRGCSGSLSPLRQTPDGAVVRVAFVDSADNMSVLGQLIERAETAYVSQVQGAATA